VSLHASRARDDIEAQATDLLDNLARGKEPILITQHGVPSAVLVDIESYEAQPRRMAILEGIARGERAMAEGRTLTRTPVKAYFAKWRK
jgi:prevent-host-death family protein